MEDDKLGPSAFAPIVDLTKWLVCQTSHDRETERCHVGMPGATVEALQIVRQLLRRPYRVGPILSPAWGLVEAGLKSADEAVKDLAELVCHEFLGEELPTTDEAVVRELLEEGFVKCPVEPVAATAGLVPWGDGKHFVFSMGESGADRQRALSLAWCSCSQDDTTQHWFRIRQFEITSFTVSNAELEALDPSHYWLRDGDSLANDQPAVNVNWWLSDLFCRVWLQAQATRLGIRAEFAYSLPTECQAEFAIRGGTVTRFWFGEEFDELRCRFNFEPTMTRSDTMSKGAQYRNAYGLYHPTGDAGSWCRDRGNLRFDGHHFRFARLDDLPPAVRQAGLAEVYDADGSPVRPDDGAAAFRGGHRHWGPESCRSAFRVADGPSEGSGLLGFRVARTEQRAEPHDQNRSNEQVE